MIVERVEGAGDAEVHEQLHHEEVVVPRDERRQVRRGASQDLGRDRPDDRDLVERRDDDQVRGGGHDAGQRVDRDRLRPPPRFIEPESRRDPEDERREHGPPVPEGHVADERAGPPGEAGGRALEAFADVALDRLDQPEDGPHEQDDAPHPSRGEPGRRRRLAGDDFEPRGDLRPADADGRGRLATGRGGRVGSQIGGRFGERVGFLHGGAGRRAALAAPGAEAQ